MLSLNPICSTYVVGGGKMKWKCIMDILGPHVMKPLLSQPPIIIHKLLTSLYLQNCYPKWAWECFHFVWRDFKRTRCCRFKVEAWLQDAQSLIRVTMSLEWSSGFHQDTVTNWVLYTIYLFIFLMIGSGTYPPMLSNSSPF